MKISILYRILLYYFVYICTLKNIRHHKEVSMRFGERLKRERQKRGYSARQLARLAGVPAATIVKVESGERAYPSLPAALKIARALGVTLDYLAGAYEEEETEPEPPPWPKRLGRRTTAAIRYARESPRYGVYYRRGTRVCHGFA
jgi:transcriptional regulator with XRE-family HTH domain